MTDSTENCEKFEFLDLMDWGGIEFSVESVIWGVWHLHPICPPYDGSHWKFYISTIHQFEKLKFLNTNSNQVKISIWIRTARYRGIWGSSVFGVPRNLIHQIEKLKFLTIFSGICHVELRFLARYRGIWGEEFMYMCDMTHLHVWHDSFTWGSSQDTEESEVRNLKFSIWWISERCYVQWRRSFEYTYTFEWVMPLTCLNLYTCIYVYVWMSHVARISECYTYVFIHMYEWVMPHQHLNESCHTHLNESCHTHTSERCSHNCHVNEVCQTRGGGLGSRPKKMYGERLGDGVEYHLMKPTPRR